MNTFLTDEQMKKLDRFLCKKLETRHKDFEMVLTFGSGHSAFCMRNLKYTLEWMIRHKVSNARGNIERIYDLGGHCDCEVLINVVSRWKTDANAATQGPSLLEGGWVEWNEVLDVAIVDAADNIDHSVVKPSFKALEEKDTAIETAITTLKDRHIIVDVDDVLQELKTRMPEMKISRQFIASELDRRCPVRKHLARLEEYA